MPVDAGYVFPWFVRHVFIVADYNGLHKAIP
jgi:hypothetical protein